MHQAIQLCLLLPTLCRLVVSDPIVYDPPIAQLTTGRISGRLVRSPIGSLGYVYQAIPYAQPPINEFRFKPTVYPAADWSELRSCTSYAPACPSNSSITTANQNVVNEDCLYLNVFAGTQCNRTHACPVLFYVHGGAWEFDSPTTFQPEFLVENYASNGLVIVTCAYRLGTLAMFRVPTNDYENITGNFGLHDLVSGLRWVQDEIGAFGGNPDKVTVMGHSSGAEAVEILTLLPAAKNFFHQAVSMSGITASYRSDYRFRPNYSPSQTVAQSIGCDQFNVSWDSSSDIDWKSIIDCMRSQDAQQLINDQRDLEDQQLPFFPALYSDVQVDGGIFPDFPSKLYPMRQPRPYLLGVTSSENALMDVKPYELMGVQNMSDFLWRKCRITASQMQFSNVELVASACVEQYLKLGPLTISTLNQLYNDIDYNVPTYMEATRTRDSGQPAFLYEFDYERYPGIKPMHAQDLVYAMGRQYFHEFTPNQNDTHMQALYTSLFSNFAQFGNPTPLIAGGFLKWQPLRAPDGYNYFAIDLVPKNKWMFHYDPISFWTVTAPSLDRGAELEAKDRGGDDQSDDSLDSSTVYPEYHGGPTLKPSVTSALSNGTRQTEALSSFWISLTCIVLLANYAFLSWVCAARQDIWQY